MYNYYSYKCFYCRISNERRWIMKIKQAADKRLDNVSIEFLNKEVDSLTLNVLIECLEQVANDFYEPPSETEKGMRENGNIRKNKK